MAKKYKLTQAEVQRKIEQFINNGRKAEAQVVLAEMGYGPEALDEGQAMLDGWRASQVRRLTLRTRQKQATLAEKAAEEAAAFEIGALRDTIWGLFHDDQPLLTTLGLGPRRKVVRPNGPGTEPANGTENQLPPGTDQTATSDQRQLVTATPSTAEPTEGSHPIRRRRTGRVARLIVEWDLCLAHVEALPETHHARLAQRRWTRERLTRAGGLVRAVGETDDLQQQRVAEHQAQVKLCQQQEQEMRRWYALAGRLGRRAAKRLPPDQAAEFRAMLGI
jgi:hypothetical protein